ncbi:MAG: hypothetical protein CVU05_09855 [Bacteroidetes bacterium HGW-Bacteroidetes-21]|jgi:hypothetical protein|nr:MAG: hypothetical protein CVU05_09855 [Bacteroidetes bacterium HGW-Bacteroidetes-21]
MKKYILIILTLSSLNLFSADRYSILDGMGMTGSWTSGTYWSATSGGSSCGCTPATRDRIFIYQTIELSQTFSMQATTGRLEIAAGKSLYTLVNSLSVNSNTSLVVYGTLEVYNLTFDNGSTVYVAPGGAIIVHNNFTNRNNSDQVTINGDVSVAGTFDNGNGGIVSGTGSITANDYSGAGTTFGHTPTSTIPDGITVTTNPLPVEFISFNAKSNGNKVTLHWQTLTEINNKWFEVERSDNGLHFTTVGTVNGSGTTNSPSNYSFTDIPETSGIIYYRLKQVDFDGQSAYTEIIAVNFSIKKEISVYPNPANINDNIFIDGLPENAVLVEVYDINSRLIHQTYTTGIISLKNTVDIQPGVYFIRINGGTEVTTTRMIIN